MMDHIVFNNKPCLGLEDNFDTPCDLTLAPPPEDDGDSKAYNIIHLALPGGKAKVETVPELPQKPNKKQNSRTEPVPKVPRIKPHYEENDSDYSSDGSDGEELDFRTINRRLMREFGV